MNMETLALDHFVLGLSFAGIAAATRLGEAHRSVGLMLYSWDTLSLPDICDLNGVNEDAECGTWEEFEWRSLERLEQLGVVLLDRQSPLFVVENVEISRPGEIRLCDQFARADIRARSVIFAPNGSAPGLPKRLRPDRFFGKGLSFSAWSDRSYVADRQVIVYGSGSHAACQAKLLAEAGALVTILCDRPEAEVRPELARELFARSDGRTYFGVRLDELRAAPDGWLTSVVFDAGGRSQAINAKGFFAAQDPVPDWSVFAGRARAQHFAEQGVLVLAGLARGADYGNPEALLRDGATAAERTLSLSRGGSAG